VVCREYPEVARHLAWLKQFGDAQMTGSGACVFVAFADEASARQAMAACPSDMRGFVARGLDQHPLHGLAEDFDG
jgi:4-diphosphocytidyl-2-C-methyl-D-erythritol kinase